jgi:RNA polymerase sigma-70 factor (ECF subfamily)
MPSDEALYERVRTGDLRAFDALYDRYAGPLLGFVTRMLGDRAEAEDVLQETFLKVLEGPRADFSTGRFRAWAYEVARNQGLNRLRGRARVVPGEAPVLVQAPRPDAEAVLAAAEASRALEDAARRLPRALAEVYDLRRSGLSYEEMAGVLGVPLGTVKSRLHETVHKLKEEMRSWRVK